MLKDVLAMTAAIVTLNVGAGSVFREVVVASPGRILTFAVQDPQRLRPAGIAMSTPGDIAAGAIESQVTMMAGVAAVDGTNGTLTIKSLEGDAEILNVVRAGDLVQITFTPALVVPLETRPDCDPVGGRRPASHRP